MTDKINGRTPEEIRKGQTFSEYLDEALSKVSFEPPEDEGQEQKKRTPEEIKKGLECGVTNRCALQSCPYWRDADDYESCISEARADALAYIQRLESAQPKWISVEERLPEEGVDVLVWRDGCFAIAHIIMNDDWTYTGIGGDPTYWTPLPEAPKEE